MAHTYHDLKVKTVAELRDLAKDLKHDAVQGYSQMNKDRLLPALCRIVTGIKRQPVRRRPTPFAELGHLPLSSER